MLHLIHECTMTLRPSLSPIHHTQRRLYYVNAHKLFPAITNLTQKSFFVSAKGVIGLCSSRERLDVTRVIFERRTASVDDRMEVAGL